MLRNFRKVSMLLLAGVLLLLPILDAAGEQATLTQEEYDEQYQAYLETHVVTPELLLTWEDRLIQYPENDSLRNDIVLAYLNVGRIDEAKACAKEALQYDPDYKYFAYIYLICSAQGEDLDETLEAAEYLLKITLPFLPLAGQSINQNTMKDINNYDYLEYCMEATYAMQAIYAKRGDEEKMLRCSDWILQRKNDSDLGYKFSLISMYVLAIYYGRESRFVEMEYWLDQYFTLEATADSGGEDWVQVQEELQPFTNVLREIDNAYLEEGDGMDINAILDLFVSQ